MTPRTIISLYNKLRDLAPDFDLGPLASNEDYVDSVVSPDSAISTPTDLGSPKTNLKLMRKL